MSLPNGNGSCSSKQCLEEAIEGATFEVRDSGMVSDDQQNEKEQQYHEVQIQTVDSKPQLGCKDKLNKSHWPEKIVFMVSIATMVVVCCSMMSFQWFLPYLYTSYFAILMPLRAYLYTKLKWQFFLADWCYIANAIALLFLWAAPYSQDLFMVIFGVCNGPVAWSIVLFRNCLVPHSIERMTCLVIHLMPSLITYLIRWYPLETSEYWYRDFADTSAMEVEPGLELLWLVAIPLVCYMTHLALYSVFFLLVLEPIYSSTEYFNNYTYLAYQADGFFSRAIKCKGGKFRFLVYMIFQFVYSSTTLAMTWIWFNFWIVHIVFLCLVFLLATYNGSTYYLDLYPRKFHQSDPYRLCGKSPK